MSIRKFGTYKKRNTQVDSRTSLHYHININHFSCKLESAEIGKIQELLISVKVNANS